MRTSWQSPQRHGSREFWSGESLSAERKARVWLQTLTRVSILRNSRLWEALSPLDFQELEERFLFLLSICKTWKNILFLLSIFKIFETNISFSCQFSRFWRKFLCLLSIFKIFLINILIIDHWAWYVKIWFYHFIIWPLSPNCPTGSWPHPDTVSDKDCRKGKFLPLWFFVFSKV